MSLQVHETIWKIETWSLFLVFVKITLRLAPLFFTPGSLGFHEHVEWSGVKPLTKRVGVTKLIG